MPCTWKVCPTFPICPCHLPNDFGFRVVTVVMDVKQPKPRRNGANPPRRYRAAANSFFNHQPDPNPPTPPCCPPSPPAKGRIAASNSLVPPQRERRRQQQQRKIPAQESPMCLLGSMRVKLRWIPNGMSFASSPETMTRRMKATRFLLCSKKTAKILPVWRNRCTFPNMWRTSTRNEKRMTMNTPSTPWLYFWNRPIVPERRKKSKKASYSTTSQLPGSPD
mmetsp:Transcript_13974/g.30578  ORF Transcript_13974/g.30578 Transcript_13974/m.30578 type:complete len:221 (+) Transcript_13974:410-1072(+)